MADEVYEHSSYGDHIPIATLPGMRERTVTVSWAGKTFSFTGWKVGWVSAPPDLVAAVRTAKQFLTFVSGAPFQPAVAVGLRMPDAYFEEFTNDRASSATGCAPGWRGRFHGVPAGGDVLHHHRHPAAR